MEQIKSIFYKEIAYPYSNNQYGLAIIIMMQKKCLYFDSSSFYFVKSCFVRRCVFFVHIVRFIFSCSKVRRFLLMADCRQVQCKIRNVFLNARYV